MELFFWFHLILILSFIVVPPGNDSRYTASWSRLMEEITLFIISYKTEILMAYNYKQNLWFKSLINAEHDIPCWTIVIQLYQFFITNFLLCSSVIPCSDSEKICLCSYKKTYNYSNNTLFWTNYVVFDFTQKRQI